MAIEIHDARAIAKLRAAGRVAAETLALIGTRITKGISTAQIDTWVREDTKSRGALPSQLGYHGFPAAVCTSRNAVVCHGVPSRSVVLADGDILNVDVTSNLAGYHGDTSMTFVVGGPARASPEASVPPSPSWLGGRDARSSPTSAATGSGERCTRTRTCLTPGRAEAAFA
jgi:methionine aminopeptidase